MSISKRRDWEDRHDDHPNRRQARLSKVRDYAVRLLSRFPESPKSPVSFRFYPYVGLRNTVRNRPNGVHFRISDMLNDAPRPVLEALVSILIHRLLGRPAPTAAIQLYRRHVDQEHMEERARRVRSRRGRKKLTSPRGKYFDLEPVFHSLNQEYFNNEVEIDHLSWNRTPTRRTLGHYDPAHRAIVLSRTLDRPHVPHHVVAFVLFHEMLHAFLGETVCNGRRQKHGPRFRRAEADFARYREARDFIDRKL